MVERIEVRISTLNGQVVVCQMEREAKGLDVKQIVTAHLGAPSAQQALFFEDAEFCDGDSLSNLDAGDSFRSVIQLQVVILRPEALIGVMSWAICEFDMKQGAWAVISGRPTPNDWCTACYVEESHRLYIIGGKKVLEQTEILDLTTGEWTIGPDLCVPRTHAKCAIFQNHIVVSGGKTNVINLAHCDAGGYVSAVEALDLSRSDAKWQLLAPMLFCRAAHGMHVVDGKLIVLGGLLLDDTPVHRGFPTEVEELEDIHGTWRVVSHFCNPRDLESGMNFFGSAVWGGELVVAGGKSYNEDDDGLFDRVKIGESIASPLPKALKYIEVVVVGNQLCCTGGVDSQGKHNSNMFVLPCKKGHWVALGNGARDAIAKLGPLVCFAAFGIPTLVSSFWLKDLTHPGSKLCPGLSQAFDSGFGPAT